MRINIGTKEIIEILSTYDDMPHQSAIAAIVNYADSVWEECNYIDLLDTVRFRATVYSDNKSISNFSMLDLIDEFGDLYPFKEYVKMHRENLSGDEYVEELVKKINVACTILEFQYGYIVIQ